MTNHERVGKAMNLLKEGLGPFIDREFQKTFHDKNSSPASKYMREDRLNGNKPITQWDVFALLKLMWESWNDVFKNTLSYPERSLVSELREFRNRWAHQQEFSNDDTYRVLDSGERLLTSISSPQAEAMKNIRLEFLKIMQDASSGTTTSLSLSKHEKSELNLWSPSSKTLYIIPCSKIKEEFTIPTAGPNLSEFLSTDLKQALSALQADKMHALEKTGNLNREITYPAYKGYRGELYNEARPALEKSVSSNGHILIISGAYGLVLATETICKYEAEFVSQDWQSPKFQKNILGEAIIEYSKKNKLTHVRAVVTGGRYAKFVKSIPWKEGNFEEVVLFSFSLDKSNYTHLNAEGKYLSCLLENSSSDDDLKTSLKNIRSQFPNVQCHEEILFQ